MLASTSSGVGKSRFGRKSQGYKSYLPTVSKCDPKYISQMVESILEDKPKVLAKVLKKKNVDINIFIRFEDDLEKMTALHYTALKGKCEILNMLLVSQLCSVNLQTPFDEATALHFACRIKSSDKAFTIAKDLIEHQADVNLMDHWAKTAAIWASEGGHFEVVRLLIEKKAVINHCSNIEDLPQTPVRFTSSIMEHLYLDTYYGNGALLQACRFGHFDITRLLLENGSLVNERNMKGSSALHAAAGTFSKDPEHIPRTGDPKIISFLIKMGADVNACDEFGFTPIARVVVAMYEISNLNFSLAEKLPLFLNCIEKAKILVKSGCDVNLIYNFVTLKSSVLTQLLSLGKSILMCKCQLLEQEYCTLVELMTNAGSLVTNTDIQLASGLPLQKLNHTIVLRYENPLSLRCICLMVVRKHTQMPLREHSLKLKLPELLQKQLCLE